MAEDLGYIQGYMGENDKGRDLIDIKIPGLRYSMPVVKYDPEGGLKFPWLPRDSNESLTPYNDILKQTIPDKVADRFKYGLERNPSLSYYEDPTFLAYDLIFDIDNSPLFDQNHPNGVYSFLNQYQNLVEVRSRFNDTSDNNDVYDEFLLRFFQIFQSGFDEVPNTKFTPEFTKSKAYYAEAISGLDKLNEKIVKYGEDKITITLTEDVSMTALYLAELYNNLVYSYKSQKYLIPDNCVRFDMVIKISDMRDFKIPNPNFDVQSKNADPNFVGPPSVDLQLEKYSTTKSHIIYRLHDCNFDFFKSMNVGSDMQIGGYQASIDTNPAKLTFDIYYKSISREMNPNLIQDAITLRNKMSDLSDPVAQDKDLFRPLTNEQISTERTQNAVRNLLTTIPVVSDLNTALQNRYKEVRGEMLSELIQTVKHQTGIQVHQPPNVYEDDIFENALQVVTDILGNRTQVSRREVRMAEGATELYSDREASQGALAAIGRERATPPQDLDNIPPSEQVPGYHRLTGHPSNIYEADQPTPGQIQ